MKIRELLTDESKWCKKNAAKNRKGESAYLYGEQAVQWCIYGAWRKCYSAPPGADEFESKKLDDADVAWDKIAAAVPERNPIRWNDARERKFEDVKALVERLDM
jgi:hypothetical protein